MTKKTKSVPTSPRECNRALESWRWVLVVGFGTLAFVVLIARLVWLTVFDHSSFTARAADQQHGVYNISAQRGSILVRDGSGLTPLAENDALYHLILNTKLPDYPQKREVVAKFLRDVLHLPESDIERYTNTVNDPYIVVAKDISQTTFDSLQAPLRDGRILGILSFEAMSKRRYPAGRLASHLLGFVQNTEKGVRGTYGLESAYQEQLSGKDGVVTQENDARGRWIPFSERAYTKPSDGESLILSIDRGMQMEIERLLLDAIEKHGADKASAIVMEAKTGKILAMAALPNFDPNTFQEEKDPSAFLNPMVSLPYEPGSIMKPITMALGIDGGKVAADTYFHDPGTVLEAGYKLRNAEGKVYGDVTMRGVLEDSINTGMIYVERLLGHAAFRAGLERFGFGAKTGVPLPAEHAGNLRNLGTPTKTIQYYTASFGQGITATPIQMISAYQALANGGVLLAPQLVDKILHSDGTEEVVAPQVVRQVVSKETAKTMGEMLEGVVIRGHGKRAAVPGYRVGGKTGTAQVAKEGGGGYEDGKSIGSFVGFAPIEDPQYVIFTRVDNPKDVEWAESSAAPFFGSIMKYVLVTKIPRVAPDTKP